MSSTTNDLRPCPSCGWTLSSALLVCPCGYDFQNKRKLPSGESAYGSGDGARPGAESDDEDEAGPWRVVTPLDPAPRVWLKRLATMLRLFAFLDDAVTVVSLAFVLAAPLGLLPDLFGEYPGPGMPSPPTPSVGSLLLSLGIVALAGVVSFIFLLGASEGAAALRNVEHDLATLRRARQSP